MVGTLFFDSHKIMPYTQIQQVNLTYFKFSLSGVVVCTWDQLGAGRNHSSSPSISNDWKAIHLLEGWFVESWLLTVWWMKTITTQSPSHPLSTYLCLATVGETVWFCGGKRQWEIATGASQQTCTTWAYRARLICFLTTNQGYHQRTLLATV